MAGAPDANKELSVSFFLALFTLNCFVDLPSMIVPTKVERAALQNGASIASLLLTTDAIVSEIPEKKEASSGMPSGGMY